LIARRRHLVHYLTADYKDPFDKWFKSLGSPINKKVAVRLDRAEEGNLGDHAPVGNGVWEMRIDWGPGPRIYYGEDGDDLVLLTGGTKATQAKDIATAKEYWSDYNA
jgi:putative addiction module killer protein